MTTSQFTKLALSALAAAGTASLLLLAGANAGPAIEKVVSKVRPTMQQPAPNHSYMDPTFSHTVTRLSNSSKRTAVGEQHIIKTDYSRVQAENADGTKLLVLASNPAGLLQYALLNTDGSDLQLIGLPSGNPASLDHLHDETEARWHPLQPNIIRFIKGQNSYVGGLQVYEYDIEEHKVSVLADLTGKLPKHWGKELYGMTQFEGEYSSDGNRLAWAIETADNNAEDAVGYVAFDLRNGGEVLGTLDYDNREHDHLSISPSGKYVVISARKKTSAYPVDFSSEQILMRETQHSDLCVTADGNDCYIGVSFDDTKNPDYGWVYMEELGNGKRTRIVDIFGQGNTSLHLSARAANRPGWAVMSTYNCAAGDSSTKATNLCDRVSLVELSENPRIIPVAWTQSSGDNYYAEPHASLNNDGSRVYFNSDWGNVGHVDVYRVDIPTGDYK